jgi:hypothetical protein
LDQYTLLEEMDGEEAEQEDGERMESISGTESAGEPDRDENVLRRHMKANPRRTEIAQHKLWMDAIQHEYPMPYTPYKIGVYIRYYNQTKYEDYLTKHKQQFIDDIARCPKWTLVDFYVDEGAAAPRMENAKEWCRLLEDCLSGKIDLIVTQKVSNVSRKPEELASISRILSAQPEPVGIYFISEDICTLASYYQKDLREDGFLVPGWKVLPPDELDIPYLQDGDDSSGLCVE